MSDPIEVVATATAYLFTAGSVATTATLVDGRWQVAERGALSLAQFASLDDATTHATGLARDLAAAAASAAAAVVAVQTARTTVQQAAEVAQSAWNVAQGIRDIPAVTAVGVPVVLDKDKETP